MKLPRGIVVWAALALCAALVIGAMGWLTRGVLAAEHERLKAEAERAAAENRADLEERTRLALWRMDALGAAIILRENRVTPDFYQSTAQPPGHPEVLLHFEARKGEPLHSPQVDPAKTDAGAAKRLVELRSFFATNHPPGGEWALLKEAAAEGESQWRAVPKEAARQQSFNQLQRQSKPGVELRQEDTYQSYSNISERAQRAKALAQNTESAAPARQPAFPARAAAASEPSADAGSAQAMAAQDPPSVSWETSQLRSVWLGGELFLLRKVSQASSGPGYQTNVTSSIQGVWMDRTSLAKLLLAEAADLLPTAELFPADGESVINDPLTLVSFPFRLNRNETPIVAAVPTTVPVSPTLRVAWLAVAMAVLAGFLLVRGIIGLSERRASFVSAVTHELRTPLTTFRLYSEMLERGAVREEKKGDYLRVLSREADRLSHLVENVLAFSRIERGNARSQVRDIAVGELLELSRERLESRLATAGMELEMDSSCRALVRVDTAAVDHILFNLIDNAAKYASTGMPPEVHLHARDAGRFVEINVRDHGPGIAECERAKIFRPFHKSAREAAETRPGVGLGLALSRRLARNLGGDLIYQPGPCGACFTLHLPATR